MEYEIPKEPLLTDVVNKEQLLHLALEAKNNGIDEDVCLDILYWYVIVQKYKAGCTIVSGEVLTEEVEKLYFNHVLNNLVAKGLLDVELDDDGKELFHLTPEGESWTGGESS